MISIGRLGAGDAAAYYMEKQAGCDLDYYTGDGEEVGRWLGDGAVELGLTGRLDEAGEQALRALLSGSAADGTRLVKPVLRADPRGSLPAEPLIRALQSAHPGRSGADLFGDGTLAVTVDGAAARMQAGESVTLSADVVGQVAEAAGLDPVALYRTVDGTDTYGAALPHVGAKVDVRRPGLDVTVSAPKTVSLLYGLGDPAVARAAKAAHDVAVGEVVTHLQRHAATAARGHQGGGRIAARIGSDGLIVAAFDHRTSRAGDPQLHTHLVIPNLVRGEDGRWSAMDTAAVYRHLRTASAVYHAVLRGELTKTLGVAWTPVHKSIAELDGIPRSVIETFSKRRAQIVTAMTKRGVLGAKAAQLACLLTRPAKQHEQPITLRQRWRAEAAAVGLDPAFITRLVGHRTAPDVPSFLMLADRLFGPDGVTKDATTFTRQDLARALCDALPAGSPVRLADIDALVTALIAYRDVIPVLPEVRERRYTTRELLDTEQHAFAVATTPLARPVGVSQMPHLAAVLDRLDVGDEQKTMIHTLVTSGRRVDVVAGPAGSGKTQGLALAHRVWARAGYPVHGAAVSWLAAQHLEASTGISSRSLTQTLHRADRYGMDRGVVLVVDEASLVNTRTLARLLDHIAAADGKLVLVGDPAQLPEIGAGGLFAALAVRDETIRLTGNHRQREPWERNALAQLRDGDVISALDAYVDHGRVHIATSAGDMRKQIALDYQGARDRGEQVLVLAARRADVRQLNTTIRAHLIDIGDLGTDELTVATESGSRSYRIGEQVLVTANDHDRALLNGTRGEVAAVNTRRGTLQLNCDDGRQVVLDRDWLATGALAHGYATTVHKAQGLTVDTTLVYGLGPLTQEHAYVALSRGRVANHIYVAADEHPEHVECGPNARTAERDERSLTGELIGRITVSRTQQLASSYPTYQPSRRDHRDDERLRRLSYGTDSHHRGYGRRM